MHSIARFPGFCGASASNVEPLHRKEFNIPYSGSQMQRRKKHASSRIHPSLHFDISKLLQNARNVHSNCEHGKTNTKLYPLHRHYLLFHRTINSTRMHSHACARFFYSFPFIRRQGEQKISIHRKPRRLVLAQTHACHISPSAPKNPCCLLELYVTIIIVRLASRIHHIRNISFALLPCCAGKCIHFSIFPWLNMNSMRNSS